MQETGNNALFKHFQAFSGYVYKTNNVQVVILKSISMLFLDTLNWNASVHFVSNWRMWTSARSQNDLLPCKGWTKRRMWCNNTQQDGPRHSSQVTFPTCYCLCSQQLMVAWWQFTAAVAIKVERSRGECQTKQKWRPGVRTLSRCSTNSSS